MENKSFIQEQLLDVDWDYYLKYTPKEYIERIIDSINTVNRFFVEDQFLRLLYNCAKYPYQNININKYLYKDDILFRARIYKETEASEKLDSNNTEGPFKGYNGKESFVPPPEKSVGSGRANPENIRYLYASSDPTTAILEVRAKPGDYVSVARIQISKQLHLFNISTRAIASWKSKDKRIARIKNWYISFLFILTEKFVKPYRDNRDYYFCQFVSEYIKNLGFDGIMYASSMNIHGTGDNLNYTIFNYEKCQPISSELYKIASLKIETIPEIIIGEKKNENTL